MDNVWYIEMQKAGSRWEWDVVSYYRDEYKGTTSGWLWYHTQGTYFTGWDKANNAIKKDKRVRGNELEYRIKRLRMSC